jgi:hypothetical protein
MSMETARDPARAPAYDRGGVGSRSPHSKERLDLDRQIEQLNQQITLKRLREQLDPTAANVAPTEPARRVSKGIGDVTDVAIQAVVAVIWTDRKFPLEERALARRAAEVASELGITGPDSDLVPDGRPLRDVARSALKGIEAAKKAD